MRTFLLLIVFLFPFHFMVKGQQPQSPLLTSHESHEKLKQQTPFALEWVSVGPVVNSARLEAVQAHPDRPGWIYAAFGSGGLWRSTDNGLNWNPLFENQPSLGIGDLAMAPSNPAILYLGTGESLKKARNFTMPGTGIYRSEDGGDSWRSVGLEDTWHISEISVHPTNPKVVLVAALGHFWSSNPNRGLYLTENGGESWEQVLYINDSIGANDVVFSPADPMIAYATLWENYPTVNGKGSAVYKSEDQGKSWKKMSDGILLDDNTGRIGIAASYQNKDKAYVFVDQRNRASGAGEMYVTTNGAHSWQKTHDTAIEALSVIGWYFMDVYVNPSDDQEVYGLGVRLIHSVDGGRTFENLGGSITHLKNSPAQTLHLDHCELWINPHNINELLLANDGGLYHSFNKGSSWLHLNNLPTGEFYDIELDPHRPGVLYGGTQDNSTVIGPVKEINLEGEDLWDYLWIDAWSGGDGCITQVDPSDSLTLYFSMQEGGMRRRNLSTGQSVSIRPQLDSVDLKYNFIAPYLVSPHHTNTLFTAGNYVMRSENRGDDWTLISPDLIKERNYKKTEIAAGALAISPFDPNVLYMGTDRGGFWITADGGKHWSLRSEKIADHYIRSIYPSRHQEGVVYLAMTGINYDDLRAYLYRSDDRGKNWKSITGNLPDQPVNVILEDPDYSQILYAGTYRGVYVSTNQGKTWNYLGKSLPNTSIADLTIDPLTKDLIIATHGRGIYTTNLRSFYQIWNQTLEKNQLLTIDTFYAPKRRDTHRDMDKATVQNSSVYYWLTKAQKIQLMVKNQSDSTVWNTSVNGTKGLNEWRWDGLMLEQSSNSPYFIQEKVYLAAGQYEFVIQFSEGEDRRPLIVLQQ